MNVQVSKYQQFVIQVWYFKDTGKFYTEGAFSGMFIDCGPEGHPSCYMNDAVSHLKQMAGNTPLPGLQSKTWEGPVLVNCVEHGFPVLILGGLK